MTEQTFLTPEAKAKLDAELEELTTNGRAEIEARIQEAREMGDLRENADYDAAKNDQGLMEARIRQITHILNNSEVREVEDSDEVVVGSLVTVLDDDGDAIEFFVAPPREQAARCDARVALGPSRIRTARRTCWRRGQLRRPGGNVHRQDPEDRPLPRLTDRRAHAARVLS